MHILCFSRKMATGGVSEKISTGELAETPPPTDYDGDDSFVVLGRSPTSFTFNENASLILQDALKSLNEEQIDWSVSSVEVKKEEEELKAAEEQKEKKEEAVIKTENDVSYTLTYTLLLYLS